MNTKIIAIIVFMGLVACKKTEFESINFSEHIGMRVDSTYSIARIVREFNTPNALFNANPIISSVPVVINGIVTSCDEEGNIYKYITIQEEMQGGRAIRISIDVSGMSGYLPLGQRVSVICNNLFIGNFAQSPQLGVLFNNVSRGRIEPGRMPKPIADAHIIPYGLPEPSAVIADTMTIAQIRAAGPALFNKLVCIKGAWFTGRGANFGVPATITPAQQIFAPSTNGVGFPQSREIQDGTGSIFVSTSEFSRFAGNRLPASSIRGNITALVGFYNDRDATLQANRIYHQLTIRSLNDLGRGFESYHAAN